MLEKKNIKKMKIETAKYLTVLDYELGKVFQYEISSWGNPRNWNPDSNSCEEFLSDKGHRLKDCSWMVHSEKHNLTQDWWDE